MTAASNILPKEDRAQLSANESGLRASFTTYGRFVIVFRILTLSCGSTSTKIAVFEDEAAKDKVAVRHAAEELAQFEGVTEQYSMRERQVIAQLTERGLCISDFAATASVGGPLNPLPGGVYRVTHKMAEDIRSGNVYMQHASHLGALVAREIEERTKVPGFIVDPVTTDEFWPTARVSGFKQVPRTSATHALNAKAVSRKASCLLERPFDTQNFVVAHIGGGSSVSLVRCGRIVDSLTSRQDGPFSAEAAGALSMPDFLDYVVSGAEDAKKIKSLWFGAGGLVSHLGTNSIEDAQQSMDAGDEQAALVLRAMAYQIAKSIGALAAALGSKPDGIIITGGGAHSERICNWISERVSFLGRVFVMPGEDEMAALAQSVLRVLRGEEEALEY